MKTKHISLPLAGLAIFIIQLLSSCTSSKIISDSLAQKRKYNKGYHLNWGRNEYGYAEKNTRAEEFPDTDMSKGIIADASERIVISREQENLSFEASQNLKDTHISKTETKKEQSEVSDKKNSSIEGEKGQKIRKKIKPTLMKKALAGNSSLNKMALASFICGVSWLVLFWVPVIGFLSFLATILGIVFGVIALGQIKKGSGDEYDKGASHTGGKGFAIAGIIGGALGLFIAILFVALLLLLL